MTEPPELSRLTLGFIPLNDCAPLAVARERGFFQAEGLEVVLSREASWANIRDRVAAGILDGAHMLGPMSIASSLGVGGETVGMAVPLALNLNGSAITVSSAVAAAMRQADPDAMARRPRTAAPLKRIIDRRRARGEGPLTFAVVFPYSSHNYQLRYWMGSAGVDPDRDVRLVVVPPPRMAVSLRSGDIDGFCVGEPWNSLAAHQGDGEVMIHASEWWRAGPDKVFGVTQAWASAHPNTLLALVRALLRAAAWADAPDHRGELAALLARPEYVDAPQTLVARSLRGALADGAAGVIFSGHAANFPWRSHAMWFASQMVRWGQAGADIDFTAAAQVYRPDLFRAAAAEAGLPAPLIDLKLEGARGEAWTLDQATSPIDMPADLFLDGGVFDPASPLAYARGFAVGRHLPPTI